MSLAMNESCINGQVILEETYNEEYVPTEREIEDYASLIGINAADEQDLMFIAREGIKAPLPIDWKACQDVNKDIYYFNFATGESLWDHPCDEYYKKMVTEERDRRNKGRKASLKNTNKSRKLSEDFKLIPENVTVNLIKSSINRNVIDSFSHLNRKDITPEELKLISCDGLKDFFNTEDDSNEPSNSEIVNKQTSDSKSEDYGRDINFGFDKSLTDRLYENPECVDFDKNEMQRREISKIEKYNTDLPSKKENFDITTKNLELRTKYEIELKLIEDKLLTDKEERIKLIKKQIKNQEDEAHLYLTQKEEDYRLFRLEENKKIELEKGKLLVKIKCELDEFEENERRKLKNIYESKLNEFEEKLKMDIKAKEEILKKKFDEEIEIDAKASEDKNSHRVYVTRTNDKYEFEINQMKLKFDKEKEDLIKKNCCEISEINKSHETNLRTLKCNANENISQLERSLDNSQLKLNELNKNITDKKNELEHYEREAVRNQMQIDRKMCKENSYDEHLENYELTKLRDLKNELKTISDQVIDKKSELNTLMMDIDNLKKVKINLDQILYEQHNHDGETQVCDEVEFRTEQNKKSLFPYNMFGDKQKFSSYVRERPDSVILSDENMSDHSMKKHMDLIAKRVLDNKIGKFLNKSSVGLNHNLYNSCHPIVGSLWKTKSLPDVSNIDCKTKSIENLGIDGCKRTGLPIDVINSLEKVTSEMSKIVEVLRNSTQTKMYPTSIEGTYNSHQLKSCLISNHAFKGESVQTGEDILKSRWKKYFGAQSGSYLQHQRKVDLTQGVATVQSNKLTTCERLQQHKRWIDKFSSGILCEKIK